MTTGKTTAFEKYYIINQYTMLEEAVKQQNTILGNVLNKRTFVKEWIYSTASAQLSLFANL